MSKSEYIREIKSQEYDGLELGDVISLKGSNQEWIVESDGYFNTFKIRGYSTTQTLTEPDFIEDGKIISKARDALISDCAYLMAPNGAEIMFNPKFKLKGIWKIVDREDNYIQIKHIDTMKTINIDLNGWLKGGAFIVRVHTDKPKTDFDTLPYGATVAFKHGYKGKWVVVTQQSNPNRKFCIELKNGPRVINMTNKTYAHYEGSMVKPPIAKEAIADFFTIPSGTKVAFSNPPTYHDNTKVWKLGEVYTSASNGEKIRELNNRNRYGATVTLKQWVEWGGYIYVTKTQRIVECEERIKSLEARLKELEGRLDKEYYDNHLKMNGE